MLLSLCLFCGCDALRSLAGRPTSEDIEMMRFELQFREARETARQDSLEMVRKHVKDSLAAEAARDSLKQMRGLLREPARLGGYSSSFVPEFGYAAVLGSFKDRANAERFMQRIQEAGFKAVLIPFRNGMTSVGACPSDNPAEFLELIGRLKADPVCPEDFWILVNE